MSSSAASRPASMTVDGSEISGAEDLAHVGLAKELAKLSTTVLEDRFFGQSSAYMFARQVGELRHQVTGIVECLGRHRIRRQHYWDIRPWEMSFVTMPETPPSSTNLHEVISGPSTPLDSSFGMTVLLVCAIGAKYSQDPRVQMHRNSMLYKTTVYDLQYYALAPLYLIGSTLLNAAWDLLGMGMRIAIEKGIHRRRGQGQSPSAEYELQKRAFWALVFLDRVCCSFSGRPCAYAHETFDVDYPIECDDEYWEADDPEQAFKQPAGIPCSITAFVCMIKLLEILAFALRTLYTNKKSKILSGFIGKEWEGRMVAELDSAMNKWKESLPDYLTWDPELQDPLFFHQSVDLHVTHHYIQIQIHRPYLTKSCCLTFSSLAMCTSAARAFAHILEAATTRGLRILPTIMTGAFTAGMVIILGLWGGQSIGHIGDPERDMQTLEKCVNILKECEKRWIWAGRMRDMMNSAGALQEYSPSSGNKRLYETSDAGSSSHMSIMPSATAGFVNMEFQFTSLNELDSNPTMMAPAEFDWDRLLLTEMGYLPDYPRKNTDTLYHTATQTTYPLQYTASTSAAAQPSQFPEGSHMSALWSDVPNATYRLEEWEAYLRTMGQS